VHICPADTKDVKAAMKKQPNKGGIYFPITAVQVGKTLEFVELLLTAATAAAARLAAA
jgi:hypothetical protein